MSKPYQPLTQKFICSTCCVQFDTSEDRNTHYKSDYHVFNLKRKAVLLDPISQSKFAELTKKDTATPTEVFTYYCSACKKRYQTENQMKEHENSKKHKANLKKKENPTTVIKKEKVEQEDEDPYADLPEQTIDEMIQERKSLAPKMTSKNCLFCDLESESPEKNLEHMDVEHNFLIPNVECCCDINGLIQYLHEKICIGYLCIWCSHETSSFQSYQAVREHMINACHCKMLYETKNIEEYDDYYEYIEDPNQVQIISVDDTTMELSNGLVIGHRSLAKYYNQNIRPVETRECVLANKGKNVPILPGGAKNLNIPNAQALMKMPEKTYVDYVKNVLRKQLVTKKIRRTNRRYSESGLNLEYTQICSLNRAVKQTFNELKLHY
ncbi:hypothetical protein EIN_064510 [Entamoeba invadens IP1]|uniref:C2H2-type domain-containing protein n=1 Tax=Entamoeba invadens IP1 TaxID=370355 RepID=A0A0A1TV92_ENTIV|nr:hypothetical protein EIN_064510 [Entamoeba invadens IP1]ELP84226.1 hypothetical protein EIN_064510 [Entamoeba invadens IP1]|eukprot:XP_004183572.1 hypothetical protein EIN_064510 [Entamoeba invadens IP1]